MSSYLKKYTGYSSGSFMGRDDGYPEDRYEMFTSNEELARQHGTCKNEEYFIATPVNMSEIQTMVNKTNKEIKKRKDDQEKVYDEQKFQELKKKLGKE
jgi:hypothetical protein